VEVVLWEFGFAYLDEDACIILRRDDNSDYPFVEVRIIWHVPSPITLASNSLLTFGLVQSHPVPQFYLIYARFKLHLRVANVFNRERAAPFFIIILNDETLSLLLLFLNVDGALIPQVQNLIDKFVLVAVSLGAHINDPCRSVFL
jgi:hypothetical protein